MRTKLALSLLLGSALATGAFAQSGETPAAGDQTTMPEDKAAETKGTVGETSKEVHKEVTRRLKDVTSEANDVRDSLDDLAESIGKSATAFALSPEQVQKIDSIRSDLGQLEKNLEHRGEKADAEHFGKVKEAMQQMSQVLQELAGMVPAAPPGASAPAE